MPKVVNKCTMCGASTEYDEKTQRWVCPYCGSEFVVEKQEKKGGAFSEFGDKVAGTVGKLTEVLKGDYRQDDSPAEQNQRHTGKRPINKWLSLLLCVFFGTVGLHRFYEGKIISGIIYACTGGLFGIGIVIDAIAILFKPNPYYR